MYTYTLAYFDHMVIFNAQVGAAVATGDGEEIMRSCLCFLVVEFMRNGDSPQVSVLRLDDTCSHVKWFSGPICGLESLLFVPLALQLCLLFLSLKTI